MGTKTRETAPTQNGIQSQKPEKLNASRFHEIYSTNKSHNYVLIFVPLSDCCCRAPKHRRRPRRRRATVAVFVVVDLCMEYALCVLVGDDKYLMQLENVLYAKLR